MSIPDPIEAVAGFLKADADVAALVSTRVFGAELPDTEVEPMPRKCVVVQAAGPGGGPGSNGYMEVGSTRMDFRCYAETPYQAMKVWLAVYEALKHLERHVQDDVLIHSAAHSGGPLYQRESGIEWPFVLGTFSVLAAEKAMA